MDTQLICVMNKELNKIDVINAIEKCLDNKNIEYQSFGEIIEVYPLDKAAFRIKISDSSLSIEMSKEKFEYLDYTDDFYNRINKYLSNS